MPALRIRALMNLTSIYKQQSSKEIDIYSTKFKGQSFFAESFFLSESFESNKLKTAYFSCHRHFCYFFSFPFFFFFWFTGVCQIFILNLNVIKVMIYIFIIIIFFSLSFNVDEIWFTKFPWKARTKTTMKKKKLLPIYTSSCKR